MSFNIRSATKKDLLACAKILLEEFRKQGEEWTLDSSKERLAELMENNPDLCFCIELEGKIIGFVFAETYKFIKGNYLWISEVAINSQHQGKGYGLKTLQFMEKLAKEKRFKVLTLVANINEKAFKIYEKFGFKNTNYCFMEKELYFCRLSKHQ
ncbi:MAG: GNAT family N-acetyltransferase [Candidatus Diapherotrites archaeon]